MMLPAPIRAPSPIGRGAIKELLEPMEARLPIAGRIDGLDWQRLVEDDYAVAGCLAPR